MALKGTAMAMMVAAVHLNGTPAMPALWKCCRCGHLEQADAPPERCPNCTGPRGEFVLKED